ncbi:MAG: Crp/Fnr family transcriptional regulator [bacterium]|nr:Crp/Fnr family transcriptional regulator [bacterium]
MLTPTLPDVICKLSPRARAQFDRQAMRRVLEAGAPVLHRGAEVSGAYIVLRGRLRVYSISAGGTEATLYTIAAGETCVFALNCLFQDLRYPAWVVAEVDTEVAVIPGAFYRHLFATETSFQNLTVRALSAAVFQLMAELEQVHFQSLDQRLVNLLLLRASGDGVLRMTQQAMANNLGSSREAVARLLRNLVTEGLVRTRRGSVQILVSSRLAHRLACAVDD